MKIKYGGSVCDSKEYLAIMRSVKESILSGGWQTGVETKEFEKELQAYLKTKYAIFTTSGSCAGLLALQALELPKGSEVIISACTFPTIFNIILQSDLTPVVVDAKVGSYTFDVDEVERAITSKTKAIIAIHPLGNPVDMPALMKMVKKQKNKIYVLEDNCDGIGGTIDDKHLGTFGDIGFTSTHAAHIVSTGVGGLVLTNNSALARNVRMYRDWGRQSDVSRKTNGKKWKDLPEDYDSRFIYEKIGYNFQPLDLQAAMGRVQLRKIEKIKKARKANFNYLTKHLSRFSNLILPSPIKGADICWFALPLTIVGDRGELIAHLEKAGIETRSMFAGDITKHPAYKNSKFRISGKLEEAKHILNHSFWIGVHPRMTQADREYVIETFNKFFK